MLLNNKILTLRSRNNTDKIQPSELLLPLNGLVTLINFLQGFDSLYVQYEKRRNERELEIDFQRFIGNYLIEGKSRIRINAESDYVMLKAMSKQSPYWVELLLNVSPYIINALQIIIEENTEDIEDKLLELLNKFLWFQNQSDENKRMLVKQIIRYVRWILTFVSIHLENEND
jgi:hypothetical protein